METNAQYNIADSKNFMPTIDFRYMTSTVSPSELVNAGIDISVDGSNDFDYQKLRKYLRINLEVQKIENGEEFHLLEEFSPCTEH